MADTRVRILCTEMGAAMKEVQRIGLKALDPRWCYALHPVEISKGQLAGGAAVVDLTHLGTATLNSNRLREAAKIRGLRLVSVHHLARLPPYTPGTG